MQTFINQQLHPLFITISNMIGQAVGFIWFYPVVGLCLFCSLFFTFRFKFVQFKGFPHATALLRGKYDNPNEPGHITHFQALMAALSGTIGLGNIAGVAIAISIGGPGTIFWMWLVGIMGMATKFVECTLGTKYRDNKNGIVRGGPMYYISKKCPKAFKPLGWLFAISAVFGAFGAGGMFQANQAASAMSTNFNISPGLTGMILSASVGLVIIGGIKRIGNVASKIVPTMCIIYILGALIICIMNITSIPGVISLIIRDAFTGASIAGGSIGTVIIWGVRRGIFSNEAGLGSASIAHAAVKTNYPIREGIVASIGPFIDTIIVCTATAIVIILTGQFDSTHVMPTGNVIAFENQQAFSSPESSWVIGTKKSDGHHKRLIYKPNKNIQSFKTPPIQIVKTNNTWYGTPITKIVGSSIQFSSKRGNGLYAVTIKDKEKNNIITLNLAGDDKKFLAKNKDTTLSEVTFKLNQTPANNEWQTHTISFNDNTKNWLISNPKLHELSLEFVVNRESQPIEIDDIFVGIPISGIDLTIASFDHYFKGFGSIFIAIAVTLFAFSTMITWAYYGEVALSFLFGQSIILPYKILFMLAILLGSSIQLATVLDFSDLAIGLMVIPNVIAILYLTNDVYKDHQDYFKQLKAKAFTKYK